MPIEGFDYKGFAANLSQQAGELLFQEGTNTAPSGLSDKNKNEIVETVKNFCFMAGEALYNDAQLNFNADQAILLTQFIGEWTFHKSIDLMTVNIADERRTAILQVIAANIFNTAKIAIAKKMPTDTIVTLIEEKVNQVYISELKKLFEKGEITEEIYNLALNQSNIKDMIEKTTEESTLQKAQEESGDASSNDKKILKLAALSIVLKKIPADKAEAIIKTLDKEDIPHLMNYMKMSNLENKIDHKVIIRALEEIKRLLPSYSAVNLDKILKRHIKLIKATPNAVLRDVASYEREAVRDFILDANYPAKEMFTQSIIESITTSIEEKINDY